MPEEFQVETLEYKNMQWYCDCSVPVLERALMAIGKKNLQQILEEDVGAELVCQFCEKKYYFDKEHLERLLEQM